METRLRTFLVGLSFLLLHSASSPRPAHAELWRSPLAGQFYFEIQKQVATVEGDDGTTTAFLRLPAEVVFFAGAQAVDYEGLLVTYVADPEPLETALKGTDLLVSRETERRLQLPHHDIDSLVPSERVAPGFPADYTPKPIEGLYVVQFAYPPRPEWYDAWKSCGAEVLATFQSQGALVRASSLAVLTSCANAPYLLWIDSYLTTDRIAPEMLAEENSYGYALQFRPTTDLGLKQSALPAGARVGAAFEEPESRTRFLEVILALADFVNLTENDPDLLSVTWRGEANFSDERQGQIVAGNYTAAGTLAGRGLGYRAFLECPPKPAGASCTSLLTPENQQLVAIFDSGYPNAAPPHGGIDHHPDLESLEQIQRPDQQLPDRLVELRNFSNSSGTNDIVSHGSIVAGIIAGEGRPEFADALQPGGTIVRGGGMDAQGFFLGSGIAPRSRLLVARLADNSLIDTSPGGRHDQALRWARSNNSDSTDRALLVNESWNLVRTVPASGTATDVVAVNQYDQKAQFYDARVRDANTLVAGVQPMTVVFAAGNQSWDRGANGGGGGVRFDSVGSPGTAKNVITVGASASYRPAPEPPLSCRDDVSRFLSDDATHVSAIGRFSGRGQFFSAAGTEKLHQKRIKPDLVAPAIRVFSTVPFYPFNFGEGPGCAK